MEQRDSGSSSSGSNAGIIVPPSVDGPWVRRVTVETLSYGLQTPCSRCIGGVTPDASVNERSR